MTFCRRWRLIACLGPFALFFTGCQPENQFQPPPPNIVYVATPLQETVTEYLEERGNTEAVELAQVRARVRGFLESIDFEQGEEVEQGKLLYKIEPEQYQANVAAAEAALDAAAVELSRATVELERQQSLFERQATSEQKVIAARADQQAAMAVQRAAEATLDQAKLDLSYTDVVAPISGRAGKTLVKLGNLVDGNEATHLTTIIDYDPIYANFSISERVILQLLDARRRENQDQAEERKASATPVELGRDIDQGYPFKGTFDYADLEVDESTGTFMVRAIFPNPQKRILPGNFVRVRIPLQTIDNALLIPEKSLQSDQGGRYLYIVDAENIVRRRDVTVGTKLGSFVVIDAGLDATERVIIEGIQMARPGGQVAPEPTDIAKLRQAEKDALAKEAETLHMAEEIVAPPTEIDPAVDLSDNKPAAEDASGERTP